MPRNFLRNSTALAVILGMSLPHLALAQVIAASDAPQIADTRAAEMPDLARMLDAEVAAGIDAGELVCATGEPQPCPEGSALLTPGGIAVQLVDDGNFILAAADQQILPAGAPTEGSDAGEDSAAAEAPPESEPAPEPEAVTEKATTEAPQEAEAEPLPPAEPVTEPVAAETEASAETDAATRDEITAEPEPAEPVADSVSDSGTGGDETLAEPPSDGTTTAGSGTEPQADAEVGAEAGAEVEAAPSAGADVPETDVEALAEALAAQEALDVADQTAAEPAPVTDTETATDTTTDTDTELAPAEITDAAPSEASVEAAQAAEEQPAAVTDPSAGTDAVGEAADQTGEATADTTAATSADPDAEELAAQLADALDVPEAGVPATDAAREAAAATEAPDAAALADSDEPVSTSEAQVVTEETSRSATEDFVTDLRGALRESGVALTADEAAAAATPAAPSASDDDDDDDRSNLERTLRQAVLPALAGLVVGQMLSNNRQVELNTGDRVVVTRPDGSQEIIKDDNVLLLRPGSTVQTQEYADGSSRTVVTREDGSQVVTIRDANLRVLRRTLVQADGRTVDLINDTAAAVPVDVASLPPPARPITVVPGQQLSEEALREALRRETQVNRSFTLGQIRNIPEVRALVAPVDIQAITFDTGSAAIKPDQAQALATLGRVIADSVRQNPAEIYMIEGHTDTVGADAMNLALSDRRAESVALALTEFFNVPPENLVVQGYGEQFLKVPQEGDIRANRRAAVRRITDLLARN